MADPRPSPETLVSGYHGAVSDLSSLSALISSNSWSLDSDEAVLIFGYKLG